MTDTKQKIEDKKPPIVDVTKLNQNLPDEYISKKIDAEGGVGSVYNVTTSSYAAFRKEVLGKGYDIDNFYGWQCWDGTALLWQQFGLSLITGNGLAIGCWDLKRDVNDYDKFTQIKSVNSLKKGDVVVMRPNHIGFFDGFDGDYMKILGQNQGVGKYNPEGGYAFSVVRITKTAFAGAFRLKKWHLPKEDNMLTKRGIYVLNRFYRGDTSNAVPTKTQIKKYVGKVTFDQYEKILTRSETHKRLAARAAEGRITPEDFMPKAFRDRLAKFKKTKK